jgi:UDP-glucose 4-epimerase
MGVYLVTGAAGFIGAEVAKRLITEGHRVITIDNLSTGSRSNIPEGVEFFEDECQNVAVYSQIPQEQYDAILHIAGYASTMSVYGITEDAPVAETAPLKSESFYGVGKIASEHYLRLYQKMGIRPTSLRLFNVYGPGQNLENLRQGMISIYLAQMIKDNKVIVKGDLERFRDFVYIDDVVESFMICLRNKKTEGKVLNVGTGVKTTVQDLLDLMMRIYGTVSIEAEGTTPGDIFGIVADIEYFKTVAGFEPRVQLKEGLQEMFRWALNSMKGK